MLSAETVSQNMIIQTPNYFLQGLSMFDIRQRFIEQQKNSLLHSLYLQTCDFGYTLAIADPA